MPRGDQSLHGATYRWSKAHQISHRGPAPSPFVRRWAPRGPCPCHSNTAIAIAYHCQCSKAHGAATFDYLTDAVDRNHFFTKAVFAILIGMPALCFSHLSFLD